MFIFQFVAYDANILYCNINVKSIMILEEGGFLIDWDVCAHVELGARFSGIVEKTVGIFLLF